MPFYIPNEADATYGDQAEPDSVDFGILAAAHDGYGLVSGGAVTAQAGPDGTVAVAAGVARVGNSNKTISAGDVSVISGGANPDATTATAADASLARFSLITQNSSSQLGVVHGTASSNPVFPTTPVGTHAILAAIFVPAAATTVTSAQIIDKRITVDPDGAHDAAHTLTGANHSGAPAFLATDTVWAAKGDLAVGTGNDTATVLTAGANFTTLLVTDSSLSSGVAWLPHIVLKTADEGVTTSTTFQDDDELLFAVGANDKWLFQCIVFVASGTEASDIKFQWTVPASGALNVAMTGWATDVTAPAGGTTHVRLNQGASAPFGAGIDATFSTPVYFDGYYEGGGTAGNVVLQWAQNASGGTTTVQEGSSIKLWRVA